MDHARQGGSGATSRHDAQPPRAKHDTLEAGRAAQRGHESVRAVLPALTLRRLGSPAARARIRRLPGSICRIARIPTSTLELLR
jgi:hypothetical protein